MHDKALQRLKESRERLKRNKPLMSKEEYLEDLEGLKRAEKNILVSQESENRLDFLLAERPNLILDAYNKGQISEKLMREEFARLEEFKTEWQQDKERTHSILQDF